MEQYLTSTLIISGHGNAGRLQVLKMKHCERGTIHEDIRNFHKKHEPTDGKSGDIADRAYSERGLIQKNATLMSLKTRLYKINGLIEVLSDPNYDGCCPGCGDTITLLRIMKYDSTVCVSCMEQAEKSAN